LHINLIRLFLFTRPSETEQRMASPNNDSVILLPAVRSDIARIAEITANSLDSTPVSQFLFKPTLYREGRRSAAVRVYFIWRTEAAFDNPTAQVVKAVNQSSSEILGFATWQFVEKIDSVTKARTGVVEVPDQGYGRGNPEPAIVKDVNMDLMRDYFTSTGHNQVQIANAIGGQSSACKLRSASAFGFLAIHEYSLICLHTTRSMASLCRSFHAAGRRR
jgi:hypothetical protein